MQGQFVNFVGKKDNLFSSRLAVISLYSIFPLFGDLGFL